MKKAQLHCPHDHCNLTYLFILRNDTKKTIGLKHYFDIQPFMSAYWNNWLMFRNTISPVTEPRPSRTGTGACASKGHKEPIVTIAVNSLLANIHKHNVTRFPYEISRLAQDIAGGLMVTMDGLARSAKPAQAW